MVENTLNELLNAQARKFGSAPALLGWRRLTMSYAQLAAQTQLLGGQLQAMGIGPKDRVAIVLPNGPEMAAAFLAVASCAAAAPLNPNYREAEFDFYLSDLQAKALLTVTQMDCVVHEVARKRGIKIIDLHVDPQSPAGSLRLDGYADSGSTEIKRPGPDDIALILHTSGTTSRPKIVPLTQAKLCASAGHIQAWLGLGPGDRCLNVMPLFHIHGLVAALLSSLAGGGSVACSEGFVITKFMDWLGEFRPTWYTAVPTMHQAIVARIEAAGQINGRLATRLRFVRSSSSPLPPQVAEGIERVFGVPMIEAYGMTEAAHQMCSNPLPPAQRRLGSVGKPAGPQVAIMDDRGNLLEAGQTGEVVIRGKNVCPGYENNPQANQNAFTNGWFRTGDLGRFDADGYLFLAGRIKEIINRGGEKISPREIDEVLLDHPAVAQAIAFAMPDPRLGEEIAAAVVLRKGQAVSQEELMEFAAKRLADFKVPRRILILSEIPKGPTGKPQRIGLAKTLGLDAPAPAPAPAATKVKRPLTESETALARIWCEVLEMDAVEADDDFLDLGGDSILAAQIIARIQKQMGRKLTMSAFFTATKLAAMSQAIDKAASCDAAPAQKQDMQGLLDDLESMSDEEAQRFLDAKQDA